MADRSSRLNEPRRICDHEVDTLSRYTLRRDLGLAQPPEQSWTHLQNRLQPAPVGPRIASGPPPFWHALLTVAPRMSSFGAALLVLVLVVHGNLNLLTSPTLSGMPGPLPTIPATDWEGREQIPPYEVEVPGEWRNPGEAPVDTPPPAPASPEPASLINWIDEEDLIAQTPMQHLTPDQLAAGGSRNNPRKYWYVGRAQR